MAKPPPSLSSKIGHIAFISGTELPYQAISMFVDTTWQAPRETLPTFSAELLQFGEGW